MQAKKNKAVIEKYFADINSGAPKTREWMDQYISDKDMELKKHIEVFEWSFPGYQLITKEIIAEDDRVSISFLFKGTHKKEFSGIPATNTTVNIPGFISYRLEDGMIVEHDMVVDTLLLMQQLGVVPEMA